jgi:hypothetical protein
MRRRVFNALSAISLLLAVSIFVLWARSYRHDQAIISDGGWTQQTLGSFGGQIMYTMRCGFPRGQWNWEYFVWVLPHREYFVPMVAPRRWYEKWGFECSNVYWNNGPGWRVHDVEIHVPDWSLAGLFLLVPAWRLVAWRRRRSGGRGFEVGPSATADAVRG